MKGWVTLHRQIENNPLWLAEPFSKGQAWVDLILNANHTDGFFFVRGIKVNVKRGQLGWSELTMAKRWKWSRMKVRRFLKYLEDEQQTRQQKIDKVTSITTIINYSKYQAIQQKDNRRDNRRDTNNNDNNDNNLSEETSANNLENMWKQYEEPTIDADTGEEVESEEVKVAAQTRKENDDMRKYIKGLRSGLNLPPLDPKQMNWQLKDYRILLKRGWSHKNIGEAFVHIATSDLWKEKMQNGEYPGMNTVEFSLRNKSAK